MKIAGCTNAGLERVRVRLPRRDGRGAELTLQALPLGFSRRLRGLGVVPPVAPLKVARDAQGKPLRHADGLAVVSADEQEPGYRAALEEYHQRVSVLAIVEALKGDPNVVFETVPGSPPDWCAYTDGVFAEMEQAGWTAGDLAWLCGEVCRLSHLGEQSLAESERLFFPEGDGWATS